VGWKGGAGATRGKKLGERYGILGGNALWKKRDQDGGISRTV